MRREIDSSASGTCASDLSQISVLINPPLRIRTTASNRVVSDESTLHRSTASGVGRSGTRMRRLHRLLHSACRERTAKTDALRVRSRSRQRLRHLCNATDRVSRISLPLAARRFARGRDFQTRPSGRSIRRISPEGLQPASTGGARSLERSLRRAQSARAHRRHCCRAHVGTVTPRRVVANTRAGRLRHGHSCTQFARQFADYRIDRIFVRNSRFDGNRCSVLTSCSIASI